MSRRAALLLAALAASTAHPVVVAAQSETGTEPVTIRGVIRSSDGLRPIAYANIEVVDRQLSRWTDDVGEYILDGLPQGLWHVRVSHPGHDSLRLEVQVGGRPLDLDLTLRARPGPPPEPLADFEPFTVEFTLPSLLNLEEVRSLIEARYPARLATGGVTGESVLRLWLDERGQVVRSEIDSSSGHLALDSIARQVAGKMRFRPAKNRSEPIRVIVLIPVVFVPPAQVPTGGVGAPGGDPGSGTLVP